MTDAQWKRVWDLYEVTQSLSPDEAERFIAGLSDEAEVVEELRGLLAGLPEAARDEEGSFRGQRLGPYEVLHRVGRGASADVYTARDTRLNRMVALKFLKGDDEGSNRRFLLEAQSVSALNHPNIVTVHEVLEGASGPVLVMEMVEGEPLRRRCGGAVIEREAVRIGLQIAQALAAAHAKGFVHRDLKPENVMVRPDGYVKVLDFGLVRRWSGGDQGENLTSTAGLPVGTLRYMSPEQCRGEAATPKSDVFALGLMLYELLAGRHPFAQSVGLEVAHALVTAEPPALKGVSPALRQIVERMLAKDPQSRPSAQEAVAQLEELSGAGPVTFVGSGRAISRRGLAAAGLAFAATGAAAGLWWLKRRPRGGLLLRGGAIRDPVFSPDGSEVVFSWGRPGGEGHQLYVISVSGGEPKPLTAGTTDDGDPCWPPGGTKIYFWRRGQGESAIYEVDRNGGPERRIASLEYTSGWGSRLGWLSPGKITATSRTTTRGFRLYEIDVTTGKQRLFLPESGGTGDGVARLSPDGRHVLYARAYGRNASDLFVRPVGGGEERRITRDEKMVWQIRWSPDGRFVYYRAPKPLWRIWKVGIDGKAAGPVATPQSANGSFDVQAGPGGKPHMVIAQMAEQAAIWRSDRTPAGNFAAPRRLISAGQGLLDVSPAISPDSRRIAFASTRTGHLEIWVTDADGNNPRQITNSTSQSMATPEWTADSRRLISATRWGEGGGLFRVGAEAGALPEPLPGVNALDSDPRFSPDYRFLYFISSIAGRMELCRMPAQGGTPEQLTREGCVVHRCSPDGRWIYLIRENETSGLYRIPAGGGRAELVLPEVKSTLYRGWDVARSGIYYTVELETGGAWEIRHFDPARGTKTPVLRLPLAMPRWSGVLSVARDESWMVFPLGERAVGELLYYPDWG